MELREGSKPICILIKNVMRLARMVFMGQPTIHQKFVVHVMDLVMVVLCLQRTVSIVLPHTIGKLGQMLALRTADLDTIQILIQDFVLFVLLVVRIVRD